MKPAALKLGILKTGRPPRACIAQFGTYPEMFMRLLGEASTLKNQMLRLDATFDEKSEDHKSFTAFLASHPQVVETRSQNKVLSVRLLDADS